MNDKEIKEILSSYMNKEMSLLHEKDMPGYDHTYSKAYRKKLNKMLWSEKYFKNNLRLGYMVRRIAIIAIIVLGLFTANEVSGRVFGVNPWEFITSFSSDNKMEEKKYTKHTDGIDIDELPAVKRDVPIQILDGLEETVFDKDDTSIYAEWGDGERYMQYSRDELTDDIKLGIDGEYQSKEKVAISSFEGGYYVKGNEEWIVWDDARYNHIITGYNLKDSKEILIEMAESLYK